MAITAGRYRDTCCEACDMVAVYEPRQHADKSWCNQNALISQQDAPCTLCALVAVNCRRHRCGKCPPQETRCFPNFALLSMVAWSRLVSGESAITTVATSATHLHFVCGVTERMLVELRRISLRLVSWSCEVPCQDSIFKVRVLTHKSALDSLSACLLIAKTPASTNFIPYE